MEEEFYFVTIKNNKDDDNNDNKPRDNIFEIMDGIIVQLNRTKKMLSQWFSLL